LNSSASTVLVDSLALLGFGMILNQITKFQIKSKSNHTFSKSIIIIAIAPTISNAP